MRLTDRLVQLPNWAASIALAQTHGTNAASFAQAAIDAPDTDGRLDNAIRAMTSFDHAVTAVSNLPIAGIVPEAVRYLSGYQAAKEAVKLIVSSGVSPDLRVRTGRQSLFSAKDSFEEGVTAAKDIAPYPNRLAAGWLDASLEDARTAALMLPERDRAGQDLIVGLSKIRAEVETQQLLDARSVAAVRKHFDKVDAKISALPRSVPSTPARPAEPTFEARTNELLTKTAADATALAMTLADEQLAQRIRDEIETRA